jgi:hypothetical protein
VQLAGILALGVQQGEFADVDPAVAGRAVFDATARFHNPVHAAEWSDPDIDAGVRGRLVARRRRAPSKVVSRLTSDWMHEENRVPS